MAKIAFASNREAHSSSSPSDTTAHNGWERAGPALVLLAAAWLALVTGLLDATIIYFRQFVLHQLVHRSPHVIWMAPVAYLFLFAVPATLIFLLAWRWPRLMRPAVAIGFLALGSTTSILILLFYQRIHDAAIVLLAVGSAAQFGRVAARRLTAFSRMLRRTTPVLAGIVALGAAGLLASEAGRERSALAKLPAARSDAPNVLFIILDTVRAASMSLYGYGRATTPNLERWAQRGVVFDAAISPSSWTLPSHASMFTGRPPHALSTHWLRPLDSTFPTLAEAFRDHGYRTGAFVANLQYATREMGLDRGFSRYRDYAISPGQILVNSALGRFVASRRSLRTLVKSDELVGRKTAAEVNREFLAWMDAHGERPFFAFLNYYDAHDPYLPPDSFYQAIAGHPRPNQLSPLRRLTVRERRSGLAAEDLALERNSYDGAIAYLDHELDSLFRMLQKRGALDNTLVVVTSDHGEEFGEHGVFYHGNSLYFASVHVPLIAWFPGHIPAGRRVRDPVSLTDLTATIAELTLRERASFPGRSLSALWTSGPWQTMPVRSELQRGIRLPEWYPISQADMVSLVWNDAHFIRNARGSEELYEWRSDPWETRNVIGSQGGKAVAAYLRGVSAGGANQPD